MAEETKDVDTVSFWTYTGVWSATDGSDLAVWIDDATGERQTYTINAKNRTRYRTVVLGGVYAVTHTSGSMYISGSKAPVFKGMTPDKEKLAEWQANEVSRAAAKKAAKMAEDGKDTILQAHMSALRAARRSLSFAQRPAFDVWVLKQLQGVR